MRNGRGEKLFLVCIFITGAIKRCAGVVMFESAL